MKLNISEVCELARERAGTEVDAEGRRDPWVMVGDDEWALLGGIGSAPRLSSVALAATEDGLETRSLAALAG